MSQWLTLFQKELLEMTRNYKWIWVPIAFILLGVMDPLSTYYLPQIIDTIGGLPEGTIIEMPTPPTTDILMMSLAQYNMLGVLIIVLTTMGLISGERKSGVAGIILVKPVSYFSYVTSKWAGALLLLWVSYFIGYLASWYYVGVLFDWVPFADFLQSFFVFGIYLSFVLTIVVFFNAIFKSPGLVGFISIAIVIVLNLISGALAYILEWSPSQLMVYTRDLLMNQTYAEPTWPTILVTIACIIILLVSCVYIFKEKELA